MKSRILALLTVLMMIALLTGCGKTADSPPQTDVSAETKAAPVVSDEMPTVVNTAEYVLYRNIFFNDGKSDYAGQETVKEGTFATLQDAFSNIARYYVWGYNDQTKCCDWQWELKIEDDTDLPTNGSLIRVTGVYEENEAALDKFWIVDPQITVEAAFTGRDSEIDMQSMDATLERVQLVNIVRNPDTFEEKTICGYGRVKNESMLEDPYYNNSWSIDISGQDALPAFGTLVLFTGTVNNGSIGNCAIFSNTQY